MNSRNKPKEIIQGKEKLFEVESILAKRTLENNEIQYKIKWLNYSLKYSSWEPLKSLRKIPKLIEEFEKSVLVRKYNFKSITKKKKKLINNIIIIDDEEEIDEKPNETIVPVENKKILKNKKIKSSIVKKKISKNYINSNKNKLISQNSENSDPSINNLIRITDYSPIKENNEISKNIKKTKKKRKILFKKKKRKMIHKNLKMRKNLQTDEFLDKENLQNENPYHKISINKKTFEIYEKTNDNNKLLENEDSIKSENFNFNEEKINEEKINEEKLNEEKINEEKINEEKLHEEKLIEEKIKEEKLHEEKINEEKINEEKINEEKINEGKINEGKINEENHKRKYFEKTNIYEENYQNSPNYDKRKKEAIFENKDELFSKNFEVEGNLKNEYYEENNEIINFIEKKVELSEESDLNINEKENNKRNIEELLSQSSKNVSRDNSILENKSNNSGELENNTPLIPNKKGNFKNGDIPKKVVNCFKKKGRIFLTIEWENRENEFPLKENTYDTDQVIIYLISKAS